MVNVVVSGVVNVVVSGVVSGVFNVVVRCTMVSATDD